MKVGVITFHSALNYGASLQTWALQKVLKNEGHEPCVINYHTEVIDDLYDPIKEKTPVKRFFKKMNLRFTSNDSLVRVKRYNNFIKENSNLLGDYHSYEELQAGDHNLDAYITGSDQVWNDAHIGGYDPSFYLEFAPKNAIKMSYAASTGSDFIPVMYTHKIHDALADYKGVSIRESSALPAVSELYDGKVEVVIDPTLLLEKEDYEDILVKPSLGEKYILVYMMENNKQMVRLVNKLSRALGLPVVQRRKDKMFENEIMRTYTSTPGEFIGLIEGAEYVVTNSFHGTVFSIIFGKPFISMIHSSTGARTIDLLESLGLDSHLLYDAEDFDFSMFFTKNKEEAMGKLKALRENSLEFLRKHLVNK